MEEPVEREQNDPQKIGPENTEAPFTSQPLGPIMGIVIIIAIIVLGGYYVWDTQRVNQESVMQVEQEVQTEEAVVSDELSDIETELVDTTELDALDAELEALELELNIDLGNI